ncbi:MAG: hypothetical protein QXM17_02365 [Metallosphaera sp.]
MKSALIVLLLLISISAAVFSSVNLVNTSIQKEPSGYLFNVTFTRQFVVDHSGNYLVKLNHNLNIKSIYIIVVFSHEKGDHHVLVLTLSSPSSVLHLEKGVYEAKFYVTGISSYNLTDLEVEENINVSISFEGNH